MADLIDRQEAIDLFPNDALEWDTKGGYIAPHLARRMIEELPSVQPDHVADISKKVSISCAHENDVVSRKRRSKRLKKLKQHRHQTESYMSQKSMRK